MASGPADDARGFEDTSRWAAGVLALLGGDVAGAGVGVGADVGVWVSAGSAAACEGSEAVCALSLGACVVVTSELSRVDVLTGSVA